MALVKGLLLLLALFRRTATVSGRPLLRDERTGVGRDRSRLASNPDFPRGAAWQAIHSAFLFKVGAFFPKGPKI
jgi:hypothetical protein